MKRHGGGAALFEDIERQIQSYVEWLRLLVESLGALVIAAGVLVVIVGLIRYALSRANDNFIPIRLAFGRYLTLALELQLAADILSTSVAPSWERIGKLAAIAVIRTALNYFLSKEIREERASASAEREVATIPGSNDGRPAPPRAEG
ncbi:DUF1622 domain-containing protein [Noviherbaspirillum sp. DKR-6]|uniref:DUF1622 domain-containing protein n=1 Tax=Noviherbaspirillum pedocola TaxID=2801341 RepID=A0A934SU32_9BURK|nr:DUF1622 domain-containing protein [Noviherbaspirillum pedocola]